MGELYAQILTQGRLKPLHCDHSRSNYAQLSLHLVTQKQRGPGMMVHTFNSNTLGDRGW